MQHGLVSRRAPKHQLQIGLWACPSLMVHRLRRYFSFEGIDPPGSVAASATT
jgi:hypothetical protein